MSHGKTSQRYFIGLVLFIAGFHPANLSRAESKPTARGYVFEDLNRNGVRDQGERGLPRIIVSNQREVTVTKKDGSWELPASDDTLSLIHI